MQHKVLPFFLRFNGFLIIKCVGLHAGNQEQDKSFIQPAAQEIFAKGLGLDKKLPMYKGAYARVRKPLYIGLEKIVFNSFRLTALSA